MSKSSQRRTILMVDDDGEDCQLVAEALRQLSQPCDFHCVHDGEELFDYLRHEGEYKKGRKTPAPDLILLDLKMPRKDGRETLLELKADPHYQRIPVVALTSSAARDDVESCYQSGVNSYVTKPKTYHALVEMLETLLTYWFEVAELPPKAPHGGKTH